VNSESVKKCPWGFYGRSQEANELAAILARKRWFFIQVTGRRRIGKTALIQEGLRRSGLERTLYIQIPDSDPIGVLTACNEYLETFGLSRHVGSLKGLAELLSASLHGIVKTHRSIAPRLALLLLNPSTLDTRLLALLYPPTVTRNSLLDDALYPGILGFQKLRGG
jgi:hypothetical protein